jgi:hypothetical protein
MDFTTALKQTMTQYTIKPMALAEASGIERTQFSRYLNKGTAMSINNGLRIINALPDDARRYLLNLVSTDKNDESNG